MAITFPQLVADRKTAGSIKHWLNNEQVPAVTIAYEAQQELYARLRCREMVQLYQGTMTVGESTIDLSAIADLAGYRQPKALSYSGQWTGRIDHRINEDLQDRLVYDSADSYQLLSAQPCAFTVRGSLIELDRRPDQAYTYRFLFYGALTDLDTETNRTNFLLARCLTAFKAVCMMHGSEWLKKADDRAYWAQIATVHIDALNAEADAEAYADTDLRVDSQ